METTELVTQTQDHRSLGLVQRDGNGAIALAMITDADFEARLSALKLGKERVRRIQREMMTEDEDYGVIPGTKKPTLLKPGAETICQAYGLVPTFKSDTVQGDGFATPHLRVLTTCELHIGSKDGPIVGEGLGASNSWERKHRYRSAMRSCPACGVEGTIRRSGFEDRLTGDKGWYCHGKAGGCGAKFKSTDAAITEQQGGQVENPDPYDVENTLIKMSAKRAQVDAVLRTTATSGLFTQDVEDNGHEPAAPPPPRQPAVAVAQPIDVPPAAPAADVTRDAVGGAEYSDWLLDIDATADNGLAALEAAVNGSAQPHRDRLMTVDAKKYAAMRTRARKVA